jgi:hypothetical protein
MESNKLANIIKIIVTIIAVIGAVLLVRVLMAGEQEIVENVDLQNSLVSPLVSFSQFLFFAAVIITLVLSLLGLFKNPENLKKTLLGVAIFGGLFIVSNFLSDSNAVLDNAGAVLEGGEEGSSINKLVGSGIIFSLILGATGLAFFVLDLVKGLIKS